MSIYKELYNLQDRVLRELGELTTPFYLTGGTALGRFYLNHRYSDDLDFFTNNNPDFSKWVQTVLKSLSTNFERRNSETLVAEDFARTFIHDNTTSLKIEFVNDVDFYVGDNQFSKGIRLDNVRNILSNKLTALIGRDEPKDVFDIIHIALNFNFNWKEIFLEAKEKSVINEIDIIYRLNSFPVELFENVKWQLNDSSMDDYQSILNTIVNDFTVGFSNSLGKGKPSIDKAKPIVV